MTAPAGSQARTELLLRELAPQVLGPMIRRHGDFDSCEDAVQEALIAAATQWPSEGVPRNPKGWLVTVASRRWIEHWRNEAARRRREEQVALEGPVREEATLGAEDDDALTLMLLCCHPALTLASQVALTLRAVGGLTTAEIARAFLVPEPTVGQRISRAKQQIKASGAEFRLPPDPELTGRMAAVLHVLYFVFNEGYAASSGPALQRLDLTAEAIRLTRQVRGRLPDDPEVAGLLALMLLTDARRPARTAVDGSLVPLAEQDRRLWDSAAIAEGTALLTDALARRRVGPYQLQAAIAAVHDEAAVYEETDWEEVLVLYETLERIAPGPMVTLNAIVALAMARGPQAGLRRLEEVASEPALNESHRVDAVRAHLLELAGDADSARAHYLRAAQRTLSIPEQRYLEGRAARLSTVSPASGARQSPSTARSPPP